MSAGYAELLAFKEALRAQDCTEMKVRMVDIKREVMKSNYIDRVQLKHEINQVTTDYEAYTKTITFIINKVAESNYEKLYGDLLRLPVRDMEEMRFIANHVYLTYVEAGRVNPQFLRLILQLCSEFNFEEPRFRFHEQLLDNMQRLFEGPSTSKKQHKNNVLLACRLYRAGFFGRASLQHLWAACSDRFQEADMEMLKIVMEELPECSFLYEGVEAFLQDKLRSGGFGKQYEFLLRDCLDIYRTKIQNYAAYRAKELVLDCCERGVVGVFTEEMVEPLVARLLEGRRGDAQKCKPLIKCMRQKHPDAYAKALAQFEEYIDDIALDNPAAPAVFRLLQ